MPNNIVVYDLLISCPSDVSEYVDILEKEVNHFNNFWGRTNNVIIRTRHWSKDSYSEFGSYPQKLLYGNTLINQTLSFLIYLIYISHLLN